MNLSRKSPSDINDADIKNYLYYLVEEKQSATSTLNQAIHALKFYYGSILKRNLCMKSKDLKRQEIACSF
jgi:site-specific recombinase XerD